MNQWSATPTLRSPSPLRAEEFDVVREIRTLRPLKLWNPEKFATAQIRGLVRQVFFSEEPVRQVVLSAVDPDTDVRPICRWIGEVLANERVGKVAVVDRGHVACSMAVSSTLTEDRNAQRCHASHVRDNLWIAPGLASDNDIPREELHSRLSELKRNFEYSIVEVAPFGSSDEAIASASAADGIILVLSAKHTRRVTARTVKEMLALANLRILGAVLSERSFPIPEKIYQRL
jgi:hypothetical protein